MLVARTAPLVHKNTPGVNENSPSRHPASIPFEHRGMKTRFRFVQGGSCRDSGTAPCMLRTAYHAGLFLTPGDHRRGVAWARTVAGTG
jgi:hypothetical protein